MFITLKLSLGSQGENEEETSGWMLLCVDQDDLMDFDFNTKTHLLLWLPLGPCPGLVMLTLTIAPTPIPSHLSPGTSQEPPFLPAPGC